MKIYFGGVPTSTRSRILTTCSTQDSGTRRASMSPKLATWWNPTGVTCALTSTSPQPAICTRCWTRWSSASILSWSMSRTRALRTSWTRSCVLTSCHTSSSGCSRTWMWRRMTHPASTLKSWCRVGQSRTRSIYKKLKHIPFPSTWATTLI